ncbi:MAG: hypothetical protein WC683_09445 [bacterium]|jgi:hypothetical protein
MSLKNLSPMFAPASQQVECIIIFRPKGAGVPSLIYGPMVSSVVRAAQGIFTLTLKDTIVALGGITHVNSPVGAARLDGYLEHTAGTAVITLTLVDTAGVAQDIDLTAAGEVVIKFTASQLPTVVK